MKLAYNPSDRPALTGVSSDNKDIIFDLSGIAIYARGVKFDGKTPIVFKKHTSANTGGYDGLVPAPSYADSATRFLREDGTWVTPDVFNPSQYIYTTDDIKSLTNYTKATSAAALATTDTLNIALGKLEYKSDLGVTAYNWYKSVTDEDTDEHINKWNEIVSFLNGVTDTTLNGILNNFVNNLEVTGAGNAVTDVSKSNNKITVTKGNSFLPLSGGTITSSSVPLTINRTGGVSTIAYEADGTTIGTLGFNTNGILIVRPDFQNNSNYYSIIHSGNIGSQSVASAAKLTTARKIWGQSFDGTADVSGNLSNVGSITRTNNAAVDTDIYGNLTFKVATKSNRWSVNKYGRTSILDVSNDGYVSIGANLGEGETLVNNKSFSLQVVGGIISTTTNGNGLRVEDNGRAEASIAYQGNDGGLWYVGKGVGNTGTSFGWYYDGVRLLITSSGNVGIGTTSPGYKLDVNGTARASGFIKSGSSSAYVLTGDGGHKLISDFATAASLGNYVTLNTAQTISGVKTFSTQQKFTVAQGTAPFTVTSTTKVTNLNADLLDDTDASGFIRQLSGTYENSTDLLQTASNYRGNHMIAVKSKNWGTIVNKGFNWGSGLLYFQNAFGESSTIGGGILFPQSGGSAFILECTGTSASSSIKANLIITDNIIDNYLPTITNYYWADQKISSSSNAATSPTVALLKATTGVQIGSTADYGWYLSNSRISAGNSTAKGVNVGSLLVSNAWADHTKVPSNGIYSKGNITTAGTMSSANWTTSNLNLVSNSSGGQDLGMRVDGSTNSIGFIIDSGNTNRGIYDYTNSVWILYKNATTVYIPAWASKGNSTTPIYINSNGTPTVCTAYSGLLTALSSTSATNLSITVGGTTKTITDMWATTASKLSTVSKTAWGQTYWTSGGIPTNISGDMTGVGNITISATGNKDYFINFLYTSTPTYSWRLGYLGSGSGNANYFVIDSSKSSGGTWHRVLQLGNETLDASFSGSVTAPSFIGDLSGNASSASKLGSSTVGSSTGPIYLSSGTATACSGRTVPGIKSLSAVNTLGWGTNNTYVADISLLAYWNGAYSGTASNLAYCNRGAFGTIVTKNTGDYAVASHTHSYAGSSSAGGAATSSNKVNFQAIGSLDFNAMYGNTYRGTFWYGGGSNTAVNNPLGEGTAFGMMIWRNASGYTNQMIMSSSGRLYLRNYSSSWSGMKTVAFTSDIPSIPTSLPANGGNADTVDGYHIAVQSSAGTNASTIYFVI